MKIPNPFNEAKKAVESIIDPAVRKMRETKDFLLNKAQEEMKSKNDYWIRNARHWIETYANRAKDKAQEEIDDKLSEARKEVVELSEQAEDVLTEKLPEVGEHLLQEARRGALEKALNELCDGVEMFAPSHSSFTFGLALSFIAEAEIGCTVSIPNPMGRLTEIRKWAKNAPSGRAQIMDCIRDFGPDSLSAGFKVCGNGPDHTWNGDDKYDRIEAFLKKHGVN